MATIVRCLGRHKTMISREVNCGTRTQIKATHQYIAVYLTDTGQTIDDPRTGDLFTHAHH